MPGNSNKSAAYPTAFAAAGTPALTTDQQAVLETAARAEDPTLPAGATITASQSADAAGNPAVTVTVSRTFTTITRFPGVPSSQTLSRSVSLRVFPQGTD